MPARVLRERGRWRDISGVPNGARVDPGFCLECVSVAVRWCAMSTRGEGGGDR
jgi:hypothetical protein